VARVDDWVGRGDDGPVLFDRHTVLLLLRPEDAPELGAEELDRLQDAHLARQADLHDQGLLIAAGPLADQDDVAIRGIAVLSMDVESSRRLYDDDPLVRAGQLSVRSMTWLVPAGGVRFEQVPFPRSMSEALGD